MISIGRQRLGEGFLFFRHFWVCRYRRTTIDRGWKSKSRFSQKHGVLKEWEIWEGEREDGEFFLFWVKKKKKKKIVGFYSMTLHSPQTCKPVQTQFHIRPILFILFFFFIYLIFSFYFISFLYFYLAFSKKEKN